jgi:glycine cleavage system H protein
MQIENWEIREDLRYDNNNFWIRIDGRQAIVGLSDYGQWVIGDILYLDLYGEGTLIYRGETCGSVESGKWVGNLIAPVTGRILKNNSAVVTDPRKINMDPYGTGWMMRIELDVDDSLGFLFDHLIYAQWIREQQRNELQVNDNA